MVSYVHDKVFENSILRKILGPGVMRMGSGEGFTITMRNFIVYIVHLMLVLSR